MVSGTSNVPGQLADPRLFSATTPSASIDSTVSFERQLESALEGYLGHSGTGSQLDINTQPNHGQESANGQFLATINTLPVAAHDDAPAAATTSTAEDVNPTAPSTPPLTGNLSSVPAFSTALKNFENDWSVLTPEQVAFQLANAAGAGGLDPSATVPGTTLTFGELNQTQQEAYQYALNYGTGGTSLQDFLTQSEGPKAAWNMSYDQTQLMPGMQSAIDSSYQVAADGVPTLIQAPAGDATPRTSGNPDNLPNPAMIQYLPLNQQAAAEAAVAAEGLYGDQMTTAAIAYAAE